MRIPATSGSGVRARAEAFCLNHKFCKRQSGREHRFAAALFVSFFEKHALKRKRLPMIHDLHAGFCHFLRRLRHSRVQPDVDDQVHRALIGARFVGKLRCAFTFAHQKVKHVPRVQRRDERGVFPYHLKQRRVVALRVVALRRFGCGFLKVRDVVPRDLGQKRLQILIAAVERHA